MISVGQVCNLSRMCYIFTAAMSFNLTASGHRPEVGHERGAHTLELTRS